MSAITAWSFSRWELYELCPLKFKLKIIDKLPEPGSPAMERGSKIHKEAEAAVKGGPITKDLARFTWIFQELQQLPGAAAELQSGFTRDWKKTGWFGKDVWFRSIFDLFVPYEDDTAEVADWKTGKRRGISHDQIELFGLSALCYAPHLKEVTCRLVYLDSGEQDFTTVKAVDAPALKAKWEKAVAPMFNDTVFAPRPNDKCRFCAFSKSEGGQCRFG